MTSIKFPGIAYVDIKGDRNLNYSIHFSSLSSYWSQRGIFFDFFSREFYTKRILTAAHE